MIRFYLRYLKKKKLILLELDFFSQIPKLRKSVSVGGFVCFFYNTDFQNKSYFRLCSVFTC